MKKLTRPTLKSATVLSAREMNALRFSGKHTILTPGRLRKLAEAADADDSAAVGTKSAVAAEAEGQDSAPN